MPGSVAVVIPCFNDGGTLEAAVTSVQDQDVPAEIIVVDDGATDSTTIAAYERLQSAGGAHHPPGQPGSGAGTGLGFAPRAQTTSSHWTPTTSWRPAA
jgi:cellulose synthase/poly-beta-1,6-N-acetylglucosamine synthase-like glycosyltransferase